MNPPVEQKDLMKWLAVLIQGATMRRPEAIQIRQHMKWLLVAVTFKMPDDADPGEGSDYANIMISNCRKWKFTPESEITFVDFEGEWPPYKFMRGLDKPKLIGLNGGRLNS